MELEGIAGDRVGLHWGTQPQSEGADHDAGSSQHNMRFGNSIPSRTVIFL